MKTVTASAEIPSGAGSRRLQMRPPWNKFGLDSSPRTGYVLGCLLLMLATGCAAANDRYGYSPRERREWIALGAGYINRSSEVADPVEDDLVLTLDGGYLLSTGRLRPSFELGGTISDHDVDPGFDGEDRLDLYRLSAGFRLEYETSWKQVTPFIRAGWFYRWNNESEFEAEPFDQDGTGGYLGAGVWFWTDYNVALGPFISYYQGSSDDDLEEVIFGVQTAFRYAGSPAETRYRDRRGI